MEYFTITIERILEFIEFQAISINKFSQEIGVSNSYFAKMIKNKASVGSNILEKIVRTYPSINPTWLLTGEGQMLRTAPPPDAGSGTSPPTTDKDIEIASLKGELRAQEKELERLYGLLKSMPFAGTNTEHRDFDRDQPTQRSA